jgi:hypothetical protein
MDKLNKDKLKNALSAKKTEKVTRERLEVGEKNTEKGFRLIEDTFEQVKWVKYFMGEMFEKVHNFKMPTSMKVDNLKDLDGLKVEVKNPVTSVKVDNLSDIKIPSQVEIKKPSWFKAFDEEGFTRRMARGMVEVVKATTQKVTLDKHTKASSPLAVRFVDKNGKFFDYKEMGNSTLVPTGNGNSGGGTTGGALETTQQNVLASLQRIEALLGTVVTGEVPVGDLDGVNKVFQTHYNYKAFSVRVYLNGIRQTEGNLFDYVEGGLNNIQFNEAPQTNDNLIIDYIKN